jgi:hypothetical protein
VPGWLRDHRGLALTGVAMVVIVAAVVLGTRAGEEQAAERRPERRGPLPERPRPRPSVDREPEQPRSTKAVPSQGSIGWVGCSVTRNAVNGYLAIPGAERLWDIRGFSSGGSVDAWARDLTNGSTYWQGFSLGLQLHPHTEVVWWQLCTFGAPIPKETAVAVLDEMRRRIPGVDVYVSAQPEYDPVGSCRIAGPEGPARMEQLVDQLVGDDALDVLPGPRVGPLRPDETVDGCHADEAGQAEMGKQLAAFFGLEATQGP